MKHPHTRAASNSARVRPVSDPGTWKTPDDEMPAVDGAAMQRVEVSSEGPWR